MISNSFTRVLVIILALAGISRTRADDSSKFPPPQKPLPAIAHEISIDETEKLVARGKAVSILDVRTAPEYSREGHIPGALLVDYMGNFEPAVKSINLDPTKPCIVYCAIGGRARRAVATLEKLGFKEIYLPIGSFNAWKKAGKPIDGGRKK